MTPEQIEAVAALLWDYLKRDPDHEDRRQTGYGTKTKQGLALSVARALGGWRMKI